ncbi:MAG: hypothetical protein AVDCRST_MAG56-5265, partial [uncultured Cytophagales bacterium]
MNKKTKLEKYKFLFKIFVALS